MPCWILTCLFTFSVSELDRGIDLRHRGRLEEAIQFFEQTVSAHPDLLEAHRELGHALALAGRYQEALRAYESLAESGQGQWVLESARWSGITYLYLGEIEKGLAQNDREFELAGRSGDRAALLCAIRHRGHVLAELGDFSNATGAFLRALEMAPDDLETLHLAGVMAARQGDEGSLRYQIEDLEQVVSRSGEPSEMRRVYHLRSEVALIQGQPKKALPSIQKAIQLLPHPLYRDTMARVQIALGKDSEAEAAYRQIVDATDERLDVPISYIKALLGLARVLEAEGRGKEAASYYGQFLAHWGQAPGPLPGVVEAAARLKELLAPP